MLDRFTSAPLELPPAGQSLSRADLLFYGVDRSAGSYEGRVFINAPRVARSAESDHPACVGSYFVFGHQDCAGDVGHCDLPTERDPFDLRLPHHLEPGVQILTITDSLRRLLEEGVQAAPVTVIAHGFGETPDEVLRFELIRLATYA